MSAPAPFRAPGKHANKAKNPARKALAAVELRRKKAILKTGALQNAILNSANFSSIATDEKGVIQLFNVGAERMLGYAAAEVVDQITPADISDPQEVVARAAALSVELGTTITPGFEALAFKASRGIEDIYELTYIRKDGSRFPAVVSVTALRDDRAGIIGYLLIGTDNTARKKAEEALAEAGALQNAIFNSANFSSIATDAKGVIQVFNVGAERMLGYAAAEVVDQITPADISDPQEVVARAAALSVELGTVITPGFEALAFKASRGIEDIYELTYIRKDGSRVPAVVSVTALRDAAAGIIGYLLIGTDNTARKKAEEALAEAGALQNAIFNSANFSSIATDAKGVIQVFNVGAERMLGYTAAEVLNKITPAEISDPQEVITRAGVLSRELGTEITPGFEALAFKASRGIEDIYELTYIRKDGSRVPAVVSVTALRDAAAGIIGYLLIGTDNTARKQAEEALAEAGALQNAIFNSANFSSIATDAKGVIQVFNVGAERMLGYTAAEVLNKITPAEISDPQEVVTRAGVLSRELGTEITPGFEALAFKASRGIEDIYELTYIRKDGTRFPAIVSVTALRDDQQAVIGYLLIGTDNSARKHAEEKLRWTEESFRLMVESVSDYAIVMLDPKGCIVSWNTGAQRIKGYHADQIVGRQFDTFYPAEDIATGKPKRDLQKAALSGRHEDEGWRVRKDGSMFWANVVFTAIRDQGGTLRGFAKLTRDLTERNKFESTLTDARAVAEKANLAKSDFLSSMSHELRSPLNAILGFAQLMESESPPPTPGQAESITQILNAGWYLLELINEVLDLATIESGKLSMSLEPVSLNELLLECHSMIEPLAQRRGIRMSMPRSDAAYCVNADRTRIKQVLINLLSNAVKYNSTNGAVAVACSTNVSSGRIRITVTDTGAGLPPEKLSQLFQPFNRLGQDVNGEEGTGIGLVVSKRLVELMDGIIGAESTVGTGSVFWIELPSTSPLTLPAASEVITPEESVAATLAGLRTLLYVEDNPANLQLVERLIGRRNDLRLLSAVDGIRGVELARSALPDIILMDLNLPGISGIEALKILREDKATAHIPVLALSANAMARDIKRGLDAGFFRYLTKPIKVSEFNEALNVALAFADENHASVN
jgi:PAS domain S-box-containing protein